MEIIEKLKIEKDKTAESLNEEMKRRWENRESETQIHMKTLAVCCNLSRIMQRNRDNSWKIISLDWN
jgi:hypothetical protein